MFIVHSCVTLIEYFIVFPVVLKTIIHYPARPASASPLIDDTRRNAWSKFPVSPPPWGLGPCRPGSAPSRARGARLPGAPVPHGVAPGGAGLPSEPCPEGRLHRGWGCCSELLNPGERAVTPRCWGWCKPAPGLRRGHAWAAAKPTGTSLPVCRAGCLWPSPCPD